MQGLARALASAAFPAGGIRIRSEPMLRTQGYSRMEAVHPHVAGLAERIARRAEDLFEPGMWYRLLQLEHRAGGRLVFETGEVLPCQDLAQDLKDCTAVLVFILTMGEPFDKEARAFSSSGKVLDLLLLETAGWLAVEDATRFLVTRVRSWAKERGYGLTRRLAPGYGAWPLTGQRTLFSLLQGTALRVQLLESCAMVPSMSRSGMWGLRPL